MYIYHMVNTLCKRKVQKVLPRRLSYVDSRRDVVTIGGVDYYRMEKARQILGISKPTLFKYIKDGRLTRHWVKHPFLGEFWGVTADSVHKAKAVIDAGWVRGKSKLPKKKAAKR